MNWLNALALLTLTALAASGVAPVGEGAGRDLVRSIEGATPMRLASCNACIGCGTDQHLLAQLSPPTYNFFSDSHDCETGHECEDDTMCLSPDASPEEIGQLWLALSTLDGPQLAEVVAAYDFVSYNEERQAFQLDACGVTIGHLPLNTEQVESLPVIR